MRYLAAILILLLCLVGVVYLAGRMQPEQHMITQSAIIGASPSDVWARMNDMSNEPKWRKSVKSVALDRQQNGMPCFTEHVGIDLKECVQRTDGQRLRIVAIADPKASFTGTWTFLIQPGNATQPDGNTTRLTITEDATVHPALWRGLALLTGMDRNVKLYLKDMARSFSSAPEQS